MPKPKQPEHSRLLNNVIPEPNSGCWLWAGYADKLDYGILSVIRGDKWKHIYAHRLSYELLRGPIPAGLDLDHKCRVHCCVNPDHLEPVTRKENLRRGMSYSPAANAARGRKVSATMRSRQYCKRGHEYTAENTYTLGKSGRVCRICRAARMRDWKVQRALLDGLPAQIVWISAPSPSPST
jgi:hypothetical protein